MSRSIVLFFLVLIQLGAGKVGVELVVDGLEQPVFVAAPESSEDYLYIVEQAGRILKYDRKSKELVKEPFLDISEQVSRDASERGLFTLVFSKKYAKDGRFYLNYTNKKGETHISRFEKGRDGKLKEEVLMKIDQDNWNHNGGWCGWGPDGYLYIAMGDGGDADDPENSAQDLKSPLGKLLRIDVSPKKGYRVPPTNPFFNTLGACKEAYAMGLRNPWRCDWYNGDFYVADVGQNKWEEISVVNRSQLKGANFGWRMREGKNPNPKKSVAADAKKSWIEPIHEYDHNTGSSITGGYVYRGSIKELRGHYFFGDFVWSKIWSLKHKAGKATELKEWTKELAVDGRPIMAVSSFGLDPQGDLYIISYTGSIYKLTEKKLSRRKRLSY